jgi:hypothetical protein
MGLNNVTMLAFTACNSFRMIAYVPQIVSVARDCTGCPAISYSTWGMFLIAHVSAVAYALVNVQDLNMALVFMVNAVCCLTILAIVFLKRRQHAHITRVAQGMRPQSSGLVLTSSGDFCSN